MSVDRPAPDSVFPHEEYRRYQREAMEEAYATLFDRDVSTVVLNLPTGIGKSAINTAIARCAESAFLTTPQKALRTQLEDDQVLRDHYAVLRARDDYFCNAPEDPDRTYTCRTCPINRSNEESCINADGCPYWTQKEAAMAAPIAVLTFSYLIIDGFLPVQNAQGTRISFADRELLVVDECHKLADQVASLHAGIAISPFSLPDAVYAQVDRDIGELPEDEIVEFDDVREQTDRVLDRAEAFIEREGSAMADVDESKEVRDCRAFVRKYKWCKAQVRQGRDWVVGREAVTYDGAQRYSIRIQPVDVDRFLQDHVWSRAEKRVLSTATMPFADTPARWLKRLGLDPDDAVVIQYPMPFPAERRPIHAGYAVGKMSQGGYERRKTEVFETLETLLDRHAGENGLIHTASYERAEELHERFPERSLLHDKQMDGDLRTQIDDWHDRDEEMFLSPAAMDGVDLPGDDCRWQVLVKVPYPQPTDPQMQFLLERRQAWDWYFEVTCQDIQQSVGRGVRSMDDECTYYVLDASFFDVMGEASVPDWFEAAIQRHSSPGNDGQ